MNKKYIIQWKSKVNGRAGRGTKQFEREHAEALVDELNEEYPDISHEIIEAPDHPGERGTQPAELSLEDESHNKLEQSASELSPVLSFQE